MRIALVTDSFLPVVGGAEFVVHNLACQWQGQGHEVTVLNTITDQAPRPNGEYAVRRIRKLRGGDRLGQHRFPFRWVCARRVERLLEEVKPDFISAHFGYPVALWLSWVKGLPRYLVTCHGPALNEAPSGPRQAFGIDRVLADAMNAATGVVALSTHARTVLEKIGVAPTRILDIPNGVDVQRFRRPSTFDLRNKFGIPRDSVVLLSVGREVWAKAYDHGIQAVASAANSGSSLYYVILGRGVSKWKELAATVPGNGKVILCEGLYGDELVGAYQQADIFFSPSVKETFPLVLLEAMAAGLPAIVTDVSGSQDVIQTGVNGIVVPLARPEAMAAALRELIDDRNLRERFGASNRERAEGYDWSRVSRRYLEHA